VARNQQIQQEKGEALWGGGEGERLNLDIL